MKKAIWTDLQEISENVRRLADSQAYPADVRRRAQTVGDLLELAATWPVPPSLNLGNEIRLQLSGLCETSGQALCDTQYCIALGGEARETPCARAAATPEAQSSHTC